MRIIIQRQQGYRGFLKKYEYTIHVKVDLTTEETQLVEKYKGWQELITITEQKNLRGSLEVSLATLVKDGAEWSAELIYESLADIPQIIAGALKGRFGTYLVREEWGVANANDVLEVTT